jgi:hypothetical protein
MKKKIFIALGIVAGLSFLIVGVALAFSMGNVDGVWGYVEDKSPTPETVVDVIGVIGNTSVGPGGEDERYIRLSTVCTGDPDGDSTFAEWTRSSSASWSDFGSYSGCTSTTGLFFSEYAYNQRSDNPDELAIEIYNRTGTAVNLSDYTVRLYTNNSTYVSIPLGNVNLADNDVFVLVNDDTDDNVSGEDLTFNGSDSHRTVVLVKGGNAEGAYCVTYATGAGTSETARSRNNPGIQGALGGTDENQVHYGRGSNIEGDCPATGDPGNTWFDAQSGLGFDGNDSVGTGLLEGTPFWLGRLTHYNRPITVPDSNNFEWIDIDIQVSGILCSNGQPPNEGSILTFTYRIDFDETPNGADPCKYPNGPNQNGCSDAVIIGTNPPAAKFTCDDVDEPVQGEYTISLLGFQPHTSNDCSTQTYNSSNITTQFLTAEQVTSNACLWAQIADFVPTSVNLKSFTATAGQDAIVLNWETTSEVENLGFNIYRAESVAGERTQLNASQIASFEPGSPNGFTYGYTDNTVAKGVTYNYWLEDVDIYGKTTLRGPATAQVKEDWLATLVNKIFMPLLGNR